MRVLPDQGQLFYDNACGTILECGHKGSVFQRPPVECALSCKNSLPYETPIPDAFMACICSPDACADACADSICHTGGMPSEACMSCITAALTAPAGTCIGCHDFTTRCIADPDCSEYAQCMFTCGTAPRINPHQLCHPNPY